MTATRPPIVRDHTPHNVFRPGDWPGRRAIPILALVIHVQDGTQAGSIAWAHNPRSQASANYYVSKAGTLVEVVDPETHAPWANGIADLTQTALPEHLSLLRQVGRINANWATISIELEGKPDDPEFPTEAQYGAVRDLGAWLCERYRVTPVAGQSVVGHRVFSTRQRANCPGPRVDLDRIAQSIHEAMQPDPPADGPPEEEPGAVPEPVGEGFRAALAATGERARTREYYLPSRTGDDVSILASDSSVLIWFSRENVVVRVPVIPATRGEPV